MHHLLHPQPVSHCFPAITSVIACGPTRDGAQGLCREVASCLSRLEGAVKAGVVIPGGGLTEIGCMREVTARSHAPLPHLPSALGQNWMASVANEAWPEVGGAFVSGLKRFVALLLMRLDPSLSQTAAASTLEGRIPDKGLEGKEGRERWEGLEVAACKRECWARAAELAMNALSLTSPHRC